MNTSHRKKVELGIEVDVLTAGSIIEIVNAIFETLLYQRNQIPFVYKTYRYYVNMWQERGELPSNEVYNVRSFHMQRKKQQATNTKEAITSMRQIIKNIFQKRSIKSLRFLFGSTIFTAKEAYTVHIPNDSIAVNHFHENHKLSSDKLNQTLLSLLTSEDLYTIFSDNLNTTNIYLDLELLENDNIEIISKECSQNSKIFPKDMLPLPANCKDIHIYLQHKQNNTLNHKQFTCCKELQVFEDLISLTLNSSTKSQNDNVKGNGKTVTSLTSWWEAEVVVRGFKDQPVKGFNIWT